jgi:hypothetical protein
MMNNTTTALKILAVLTGLLVLGACNPIEKSSKSNSMLVVESITGTTIGGTTGLILESDVSTTTSDTADVTLRAELIDPTGGVTGPSQYNDITLTGYSITYTLPGGGGVAGTDVPYPIEGTSSSLLIKIGESKTVTFVAVLSSAKLVAPLDGYLNSTTPHQIVAQCTFTGHDGTNHPVEAKGQLTIIFADYQ